MAHKVFAPYDEITFSYDYEEPCPHCGNTIAVVADEEQADLETICPVCGEKLMLCSACDGRCDWSEANGCRMDKAHTTTTTTDLPQTT